MSLHKLLKESTKDAHRIAESKTLQKEMLTGKISLDILGNYLFQLYVIHKALELHFTSNSSLADSFGWSDDYSHSKNLENDLRNLGCWDSCNHAQATTNLLDNIDLFIKTSPETLVGFFYVLEGSMNGNRFIVRAIRGVNQKSDCDFIYFDPYGEEQRNKWVDFTNKLDQFGENFSEHEKIVESALVMFDSIGLISSELMDDLAIA